MLERPLVLAVLLCAPFAASSAPDRAGFGTSTFPAELAIAPGIVAEPAAAPLGGWLRIRGFSNAPTRFSLAALEGAERAQAAARIEETRASLARLRADGYRVICKLRWERVWPSGARPGAERGNRAPLDLREAHARARALAETYGDLVDAWEFENEPDIGFFADNADVFAAYYKAVSLGLSAGRPAEAAGRSRVVMPALALPPGPFADQLFANGVVPYTEAVNLHYHGFGMDYADAHARLRERLASAAPVPSATECGPRRLRPAAPPGRALPVFVTESGYPRLDAHDAQTVEGRARQWRHFRAVQLENERLGVAAPMTFYLPPLLENAAKEFGLAMPADERRAAHFGFAAPTAPAPSGPEMFRAGGLTFVPADFGAPRAEPWMRRIGFHVGDAEASPALAWLAECAAPPATADSAKQAGHFRSPPRSVGPGFVGDWRVNAEPPSPVIMDFVGGEDTLPVKAYVGYLLGLRRVAGWPPGNKPDGRDWRTGAGSLVLYHFGNTPAEVRLRWPEGMRPDDKTRAAETELRLDLAPGERREIPVRLGVRGEVFAANELSLVARVRSGGTQTDSRWAARVYPMPDGHAPGESRAFDFPAEAAVGNRAWLLARPRADDETTLQEQGRWLASPGLRVEETASGWRFHVDSFPGVGMSPAVAELPLPDDWSPWEHGLLFGYDYRIWPASLDLREPLLPEAPDPKFRHQTGKAGDVMESYLRTRTGALYSTQPRLSPGSAWARYQRPVESLTPGFAGRLAAPLRVEKERPAALVFFFRPAGLPTTFEVKGISLARWSTPPALVSGTSSTP